MFAALVLFLAASLTDSKSVRLPAGAKAFFLTLLAIVWLQWAGGLITYGGDALVSSLFLAGTAMAWYLGARAFFVAAQAQRFPTLIAALTAVAACTSTLLAILQWLNLEQDLWFFVAERGANRPYANLGQPNLLATLLVMGLVFSYLLFLRGRINTWQWVAMTVWLSFGVIVTESKAALLSAFCVGVFILVWARPNWELRERRIVALWWGVLGLFATLWRPLNHLLDLPAAREAALDSTNIRLAIWKQVIAAISEAPWLGYGWRQTAVAQKFGVEIAPGDFPTDYAHNVILDIVAWVGLPIGIVLSLLCAWWILRTIKNIKNTTEFMLLAATVPLLIHSMVEFPFAYAFFLLPVAAIFGFLHASQEPHRFRITPTTSRLAKGAQITGLLGFAVLCGLIATEYLAAEEDFRVLRFELRRVGSTPVDYQKPRLPLLTQLDDLLTMGRMQPTRGMSSAEIEHLRKANLSRHWAALNMKYVIALGINGQPAEATKQLHMIKALYTSDLYRSALDELRSLASKEYPELAQVVIQ